MANTTKGGVQRLNLDQVTLQGTVVTATGAEINNVCDQTGRVGTFVCNGATAVVVAAPAITADSIVIIGLRTVGGTVGAIPRLVTITPGTGFNVAGTASDTSTYNYRIIN
jgi:hypothetical protein